MSDSSRLEGQKLRRHIPVSLRRAKRRMGHVQNSLGFYFNSVHSHDDKVSHDRGLQPSCINRIVLCW